MSFGGERFSYSAQPVTESSADLTILLAAVCVALGTMRVLCALAVPGEPDDPSYSITIASTFG